MFIMDKLKKKYYKYRSSDFAFLITSVGEKYLSNCVNSVLKQKDNPGQIIVSLPKKINYKNNSKNILVIKSNYHNQVYQRSLAKNFLKNKIKILIQLDCGFELCKNSFKDLIEFWSLQDKKVAGLGMIPVDQRLPKINILQKVLLTNSSIPGKVLKSGYVSAWSNSTKTCEVEWLNGGCVSWRLDLCQDIFKRKYPMISWSVAEDLIYSFNKKKKYKLIISNKLKIKYIVNDKNHVINIYKNFQRGFLHSKIIKNFVSNDKRLTLIYYYYTTIFSSVIGILISILQINLNKLCLYFGRLIGGIVKTYKYKIR